ncbi:hypothetical protein V6Z12_A13G237300 [Gossypium hirsutum]
MTYDGLNDSVLSQDNKKELKLMNLEELNLRGNVFNSSILSSLGSLSNLKSLSLFHIFSMEGSIDVRGLPALKYLEKLYVSCQSEYVVAELQLQSLDIFPSLKTLSLEMFSLKGTIIIQTLFKILEPSLLLRTWSLMVVILMLVSTYMVFVN